MVTLKISFDFQSGSLSKEFEAMSMDKISVDPDGTRNRQYHFTTQGYLANEVSVRADQDKRTLGQILRQKLKEV